MIRYIKEYRFYIALFIFLLIPVLAIDTSTRKPADFRLYDKAIVFLTSPIQAGIALVLENTFSAWNKYLFLFHTQSLNSQLIEENQRLLNSIANLKEAQDENVRLRNLMGFQESFELKSVVARVIAKDVSPEFRILRINRGENAGIKKDMAVVNMQGVVGRVLRVTATTADVVTILDVLSAVDAIVKRSRARGIIEGFNDEFCQLKFALRSDDIQVGDLLISSGLGGFFPKGIPVGSVSEVAKKNFGITQNVQVRPSVDFSRLEEVLVVTQFTLTPTHTQSEGQPEKQTEVASP